jgi:hypothetical protein
MQTGWPPSTERRRHQRYELLAQVHVKYAKVDYVLALGNLSESGALLCFGSLPKAMWARLDAVVELAIVNPETYDSVCLNARIVRIHQDADGHGFGVEFLKPDEPAREGLFRLIELAEPLASRRSSEPGT